MSIRIDAFRGVANLDAMLASRNSAQWSAQGAAHPHNRPVDRTKRNPARSTHVLVTDGSDSYRLAQATAGKGVRPLA